MYHVPCPCASQGGLSHLALYSNFQLLTVDPAFHPAAVIMDDRCAGADDSDFETGLTMDHVAGAGAASLGPDGGAWGIGNSACASASGATASASVARELAPSAPAGVPPISARIMQLVGTLASGAFGTIDLVDIRGVTYASKRTSTRTADWEALARELAIYNRVHRRPHPHITPLYGVCTDHTDGLVRLVMRRAVCSLESLLKEARAQVG
jgi:hypothetical protein